MAKHARLSASGSKQWINCPGSVQKEQGYPEGQSSVFAQQGTAAHALADYCLTTGSDAEDHVGSRIWVHDEKETVTVPAKVPEGGKLEERLAREGFNRFTVVDGEGNGEVSEVKCWAVMLFVNEVRTKHRETIEAMELLGATPEELKNHALRTEEYMDGSWLHPLMGGTADANFIGFDNWVRLFDLKFGAGVLVEIKGNTQQMIYAVLILHLFPFVDGVEMSIVQPRMEHAEGPVRTERYTRQQLLDFQAELKDLADQTQKRNAPINAGDWCLWCKAKIDCDAFKERTQELARMSFDDPPDLVQAPTDIKELEKLARWIPMLDALADAVHGAIGRELHQGREVEGFKLVRAKTNRRFGRPDDHPEGLWERGDEVPEEEIVELMLSRGMVGRKDIYHPAKLLTLAQMEKLGKDAKEAIKAITYKPEGALTVVESSDKREAVKVEPTAAFPDDDLDSMEIPK